MNNISPEQANRNIKISGLTKFPLDIFPALIQDTVIEMHENGNYNIDYFASSILTALAAKIGSKYYLKYNAEWIENVSLWVVIVGKSGQNKSAPIKTAFKSIVETQNEFNRQYEREIALYVPDNGETKPILRKLYTTDPTFEALIKMHKQNPHGIVIKTDEFKSFINNLTGYSGVSKQSNYLSIWDGSPISLDRKEAESYSISKPCVSVIGGIQDDVLSTLKAKDIKDGFFERMLFVIPEKMEKRKIKSAVINERLITKFHSKMKQMLDALLDMVEPCTVELSDEANDIYVAEYNKNVEQSNKESLVAGILSKLDRYILRFALIIEVTDNFWGNGLTDGGTIEIDKVSAGSIEKAINLKNYFFDTALKLNNLALNVYENSIEGKMLKVLKAIGRKEFSTKEFISKAEQLNIAKEAYSYRMLSQSKLVYKVTRGMYQTDIFN